MPARYERLPNPSSSHDPEGELEAAFELNDDDEDREQKGGRGRSQALTINTVTTKTTTIPTPLGSAARPGGYDFERQDYDFPPPGSPPPPTSRALPNDFGNSNGIVPSSPAVSQPPRPSFFRRAMGAFLPSQYTRVATSESSSRTVGGGTENDGVFANVAAKPQPGRMVQSDDGNFVVPEEVQKEMPPTYAEAQADAVPPYWETTIHAPASLEPGADMIIDDLPTGTFIIFALNFIISWFFQFIGFFLTYMLHTSHAAKFGSRAGLGMTLIQFGFYSRQQMQEEQQQQVIAGLFGTVNNTMTATPDATVAQDTRTSQGARDWLSFFFMTIGWFLLLSSTVGFWRVKRWESSLRAPPAPDPTAPEEIERDQAIRRNIANVFGITIDDNDIHVNARFNPDEITPQQAAAMAAEARLTRDLRAAGLL